MKFPEPHFCGLDLQKSYFSLVQYVPAERAVSLVSIQPFSGEGEKDPWKTWADELKNTRERLRFFGAAMTFGLPAEFAVIKIGEIDADEPDVEEAASWEFGQQILSPAEVYLLDHQQLSGHTATGTVRVLLAAYRRELVNRTVSMLRKVKLRPQVCDLDVFGLINVFEANYPELLDSPALLVHAEPQSTRFVLTKHGEFLDFHCFEYAINFGDPAVPAMSLAAEVELFLAVAERQHGAIKVFAAGSFFQRALTREAFLQKIRNAEMLNPFRNITCQVSIEEQQLEEYSSQLAVAVGLAIRGSSEVSAKEGNSR